MPLIAPGNHLVQIHSAELVKSKNTPDSWNLKVVCKTVDECEDPEGKKVAPGFQLITYLQVPVPGTEYGEGANKDMFIKKLTLFQVAVAGLVAKGDTAPEVPRFNHVYIAELPTKYVIATTNNNAPKKKEGDGGDDFGIRSQISGFKANLSE
jgi:hypothetical protein